MLCVEKRDRRSESASFEEVNRIVGIEHVGFKIVDDPGTITSSTPGGQPTLPVLFLHLGASGTCILVDCMSLD